MPKSHRKVNIYLSFVLSILALSSLIGAAFAAWNINPTDENDSDDVNVSAGSRVFDEMTIDATVTSNSIYFDADDDDTDGIVGYEFDGQEANLEIKVEGNVTGAISQWKSIRPSLEIRGNYDDTTTYQDIYDELVLNEYIEPPAFDDLPNDGSYGTNKSNWTSMGSSGRWFFTITSSFSYGSFFNGMNPSVFFDSDVTNGIKLGSSYTRAEIKEVLTNLGKLNGAKFVVMLRVLTEENSNTITFDANSGKFSTTNSETDIVYSDILRGDYISFPRVYRSSYTFNYYYPVGHQSVHLEEGKRYRYDYLLDLISSTERTNITFLASWASTTSSFTITIPTDATYTKPVFSYHIFPSNPSSTEKTVTVNASATESEVNIGDVIAFNMTPSSNVDSYSVTGFAEVADGTVLTGSTTLTVASATPTMVVTPTPVAELVSATLSCSEYNYQKEGEVGTSSTNNGSATVPITVNPTPTNVTITNVTYQVLTSSSTDFSSSTPGASQKATLDDKLTFNVTLPYPNGSSQSSTSTYAYYRIIATITDVYGVEITNVGFANNNQYIQTSVKTSCVLPETLITMADGSYKMIKDVKAGELVLTFDHENGKIAPSPVVMNEHAGEDAKMVKVINLVFDDIEIGIIGHHGFYDLDLNKYVCINIHNYSDFIGHKFTAIDPKGNISIKTLISAYIEEKVTCFYALETYKNYNYITNDLLSFTGKVCLVNMFEFDENMKIDQAKKQRDIEKYGLYTYETADAHNVPRYFFDTFNCQYYKVSVGKGLMTWDDIMNLVEKYRKYF